MRIAHLIWSMGVGGTQTLLTGIANLQVQIGHEVGIFIVDDITDPTIISKIDSRIKLFYLRRKRGTKAILPYLKLNWQLWKFRPDIIHSHIRRISKTIFTSTPMVATFHHMGIYPKDYKKYRKFFAISNAVKVDAIQNGFDNVVVIENGIPCNEIKCRTDFKRSDTIHIVLVSRISFSPKRQDLAVQALSLLNKRLKKQNMANKRSVMYFVGDGPDMDKLKEMVSQLGLENDVMFEGFKDRNWVFDHLRDYDLFLQPSDNEGFGLTVAEACAAKLPVLVSDIDGPLEIIRGGELGMVFRHSDADDLADKLFNFIRDGYDTSIIEKAYQNTLEHYGIAKTAQRYIEEYEKVISNQKK